MAVLLVGTLDTKGTEYQYVRDLLLAEGVEVLVLDAGLLQPTSFEPDISREQVYAAGGVSLSTLLQTRDRGQTVSAAAKGVTRLVTMLHAQGKVSGMLGLGGSAGTTIATAAMRALPFGLPKVMVSTLASGQVQPFVGVSDILMLPSVVDVSGLNRISRQVLQNAAWALLGMLQGRQKARALPAHDKPLLASTMFGVTTPCVEQARSKLEAQGYEMLVFHATGTGGRTMESFVRDGLLQGVLDLTTTELADELVGGVLSAGPDRLTAASLAGVPQVISVGALDMVNFGPASTVPEKFRERRFYQHNANVTLMRTTPDENDQLGKEIAQKASASRGPVAILLPLRGISAIDAAGQPFHWPDADAALFQSIRDWLSPHVQLLEYDLHINDPAFAQHAVDSLLGLLKKRG